jgi:hypothetical protein
MKRTHVMILAAAFAGIITLVSWARRDHPEGVPLPPSAAVAADALPGLQLSNGPWIPEMAHLAERLQLIGLPALREEGTAFHIHQHLDLFINGQSIPIPAEIGINRIVRFISPVHTHDASGTIHIESPEAARYTLGQFFDIWGVRLTPTCLGGYCATGEKSLRVYVNGSLVNANIRNVVLEADQAIVLAYGTAKELPNPMPSKFKGPE